MNRANARPMAVLVCLVWLLSVGACSEDGTGAGSNEPTTDVGAESGVEGSESGDALGGKDAGGDTSGEGTGESGTETGAQTGAETADETGSPTGAGRGPSGERGGRGIWKQGLRFRPQRKLRTGAKP